MPVHRAVEQSTRSAPDYHCIVCDSIVDMIGRGFEPKYFSIVLSILCEDANADDRNFLDQNNEIGTLSAGCVAVCRMCECGNNTIPSKSRSGVNKSKMV